MPHTKPTARVVAAILMLGCVTHAGAQQADAAGGPLHLTPPLRQMLRAEMREVARGVEVVTLGLASADWKTLVDTSERIRASYILDKQLSPSQKAELEHALPTGFKQLDAEFHLRAEKLGQAAAAHDSELAVFHFSRMLEACARCHAAYATSRFPGFGGATPAHAH